MKIVLILLLLINCAGCNKKDADNSPVEIYLLSVSQNIAGKCQVDPLASSIDAIPAIKSNDILGYSQSAYEFKLTDAALQKVKTFNDRQPFAVTVGRQVIYYGFFKPGYSSSACDQSITMDISWSSPDSNIKLSLGYPWGVSTSIDDQRNNAKLLAALKREGKLMP